MQVELNQKTENIELFGNKLGFAGPCLEEKLNGDNSYPNNSKWVSWIFPFLLMGFSKEIVENLFHKWGIPWGYM